MLASGNVEVAPWAVERRFIAGIGVGAIAAILLMVVAIGARADLLAAMHLPMFWGKLAFTASLAAASLLGAVRLARPGVALGRAPLAAAAPVAALWMLAIATLLVAEPTQRAQLIFGKTWTVCPLLIAILAIPVFAGAMWTLAGLAPTRLRLAGATAGLLSGAIAAFVYSLHCPEMAAPFLALWYVLGIVTPAALGAWLGPRLLRW